MDVAGRTGTAPMKRSGNTSIWIAGILLAAGTVYSQNSVERTFPQSKATVERALKSVQSATSGHLPALEGFAQTAEHPLDQYRRGFYQATIQVTSTPTGGAKVRVSTKITAWFNDPSATHSGYQLLTSNGRLESDLLDQLGEELGKTARVTTAGPAPAPNAKSTEEAPTPSQPAQPVETDPHFASAMRSALSPPTAVARPSGESKDDAVPSELQAEANNLEDILKNQGHPKNLVAVKKSGTPVVESPSLNAKPLFLASQHDEFEMLDFNADWVHVRISGLSRGWIWRNSLEMPEGISDTSSSSAAALTPAADIYRVEREETAPFPGDWAPLRGKKVKIISVQKNEDSAKGNDPKLRLEYAKSLLEKSYVELAKKPELLGVVVIFDSADGGMIAATMTTLQQWKAGTLTDAAFWHKCFFDPPETLDATSSGASR